MKVDRLKVITKYINNMPSLPVTVSKVQEICDNPKTSPVDLYKVISLDPVLMGKVMRLINSAYYGLSDKVTLPCKGNYHAWYEYCEESCIEFCSNGADVRR